MKKIFKIFGFIVISIIIAWFVISINFGRIYYWYSIIDFNKNQNKRERIVELIKSNKLRDYTFSGSANWINLPDSLKQLSEQGNVRIEILDNKLSIFFYQKFRDSEDPIGFAYFDGGMTANRLMRINNPNSFFFSDKWVKEIKQNWYYIEYKTERVSAP